MAVHAREVETHTSALRIANEDALAEGTLAIPLDVQVIRDCVRVALEGRPLTGRRVAYFGAFGALFAAIRGAVEAGRKLDEVFFPEYRAQPVRTPFFVFANARSGTTLLHRLMSLDEERFAPIKLYQALFPSVTWNRVVDELGRVDRMLGGSLSRLIEWIDETQLSGWEGIHEMGLGKEEEDEAIFLYTLVTTSVSLLFPRVSGLARANWLDRLEKGTRRALMAYYKDTIRRHLYAAGGDRVYLNKNVLFTPRARSAYETFPDARFIYLIRHPYEAIPSFLSMFWLAWHAHTPDLAKDSVESRELAQLAIDYYRYALEFRNEVPSSQFVVVQYRELVADPRATIEGIYAHFGLTMSDAFRERLKLATMRARSFKSEHEYSLEEFGLSREFIASQLGELFDEFGFER